MSTLIAAWIVTHRLATMGVEMTQKEVRTHTARVKPH